jgi:hypothetical protein
MPLSPANCDGSASQIHSYQFVWKLKCGRLHLFLLVRCEDRNLTVGYIGPLHELLPPLHNRDTTARAISSQADVPQQITHEDVQRTRQDFLIVQAAVMPTSVLPAPQGRTMIPERARLQRVSIAVGRA